jgi:hypothetical protein
MTQQNQFRRNDLGFVTPRAPNVQAAPPTHWRTIAMVVCFGAASAVTVWLSLSGLL